MSTESQGDGTWPAAVARVPEPFHYTTEEGLGAKLGWVRADGLQGARKPWPKQAYLYFPEQGLEGVRVVVAVLNPSGKRCRSGELHAPLEVLANRVRAIISAAQARLSMSETGVTEHIRTLGLDLGATIDHELRTPLSSITGYSALLREMNPAQDAAAWNDYWGIVESQTSLALEAVDKLSLALHAKSHAGENAETLVFDADSTLRDLCEQTQLRATELVGDEAASRVSVRYLRSTDRACVVRASPRLFRWALWEVLKNAVTHSRHGRVEVAAYASERMLVIDVEDDGVGVAAGSEELIFLRFYQDPSATSQRRVKRGLGLGLFLARQITERHLGQLTFIRVKGKGGVFRFLWPLAEEDSLRKGA